MKTALVTGGAGGIGSAICTGLARAGCQVAVHYNTKKETAEALAAQLQKSCGIKAIAVCADVKDRESVNRMFDKVDKALGGVDILVNNAGIAQQKLFTDLTVEDWRAMLDTNLSGVFNCSQEALRRHMLPVHSGAILNISSMWGQVGASCEVHYSAAKAGVIG
ncbi:SDR family NAD(P)-dependent oxidoreductase, partial [Ruminococcus difficilis]